MHAIAIHKSGTERIKCFTVLGVVRCNPGKVGHELRRVAIAMNSALSDVVIPIPSSMFVVEEVVNQFFAFICDGLPILRFLRVSQGFVPFKQGVFGDVK